jgi:hypothetical protein
MNYRQLCKDILTRLHQGTLTDDDKSMLTFAVIAFIDNERTTALLMPDGGSDTLGPTTPEELDDFLSNFEGEMLDYLKEQLDVHI